MGMAFQNDGSEELCDAAWRGGVGGDTVRVQVVALQAMALQAVALQAQGALQAATVSSGGGGVEGTP